MKLHHCRSEGMKIFALVILLYVGDALMPCCCHFFIKFLITCQRRWVSSFMGLIIREGAAQSYWVSILKMGENGRSLLAHFSCRKIED